MLLVRSVEWLHQSKSEVGVAYLINFEWLQQSKSRVACLVYLIGWSSYIYQLEKYYLEWVRFLNTFSLTLNFI